MTLFSPHTPHAPPGTQPQRINLNDKATTQAWMLSLGVSLEQLRRAVAAVGDTAADVAAHLQRGTLTQQLPAFASIRLK